MQLIRELSMSAEIQNAADVLRSKAAEKVEEIKGDPRMVEAFQFIAGLNALEVILQQPKTTISSLFAFDAGEADATSSTATVAIDEFVNVAPLEAAKRYLKKVSRPPRSLDDIIAAIKAGGGEVPNRSSLRVGLNRS